MDIELAEDCFVPQAAEDGVDVWQGVNIMTSDCIEGSQIQTNTVLLFTQRIKLRLEMTKDFEKVL